ncbi:MoaD/ThiS family protein [Lysobacter sp. A3-1-A15]|uniref:MoaD/ThiS family protein n=1 Tax=Novilysobacter viscosus TaxID=3098602 RepID=UPI002ED823BF
MSVRVAVLYFASLRDAAGCGREEVATDAADLAALYRELSERHGFVLPIDRLRVSMGDAFVDWGAVPLEGAEVAFIPPVSGG